MKQINYSERICQICNMPFIPTSSTQKFCKRVHIKKCCICGKEIECNKPWLYDKETTCSYKCRTIKTERTNLELYGVKNTYQAEKSIKIKNKRWDKGNPFNHKEIQEQIIRNRKGDWNNRRKCRQTCLEKYSVENVSQIDKVKNKKSETLIKNYNVDNPMKNKEIRNKAIRTCLEKYNNPLAPSKNTSKENEIVKFIKSINDEIQIIQNTKSIIYPYELDIYLPDYNLAIEYNSSYFHNKDNQIREKYKTELCKEKGIELIHIWEDEFENFKEKLIKNISKI